MEYALDYVRAYYAVCALPVHMLLSNSNITSDGAVTGAIGWMNMESGFNSMQQQEIYPPVFHRNQTSAGVPPFSKSMDTGGTLPGNKASAACT
jgi:hypothetical protein